MAMKVGIFMIELPETYVRDSSLRSVLFMNEQEITTFGDFVECAFNQEVMFACKVLKDSGKSEDEILKIMESKDNFHAYSDLIKEIAMIVKSDLSEQILSYDKDDVIWRNEGRSHIQETWGEGLAWMRQYYSICVEVCTDFKKRVPIKLYPEIQDSQIKFGAIDAIHATMLGEYNAIICLLESGLAQSALIHNRVMEEHWAIAQFLFCDTSETSKRYIESQIEKSDSEQDHYLWAKNTDRFMSRNTNSSEKCEICRNRNSNPRIGWIVKQAHKTLSQQSSVKPSLSKLGKIYTYPNIFIHPSAKGVFGRTTIDSKQLLVGSTDIGLSHIAINASIDMFNTSKLLFTLIPHNILTAGILVLDEIIGNKIIPISERIEKFVQSQYATQ